VTDYIPTKTENEAGMIIMGKGLTSNDEMASPPRAAFEEIGSWCIWTKFGRRPQFYHPARELAMAEAERLALKNPGQKFIVMKMEGKFGVPAEEPGIKDATEHLIEEVTA